MLVEDELFLLYCKQFAELVFVIELERFSRYWIKNITAKVGEFLSRKTTRLKLVDFRMDITPFHNKKKSIQDGVKNSKKPLKQFF